MATAAQVRANRANAQKSTGPRTAEGQERASQNAVKHGLLAREAVIAGEDPEEFALYREGMLADLAPVGPVEAMLAQRVVGLSWRLRRAERLQDEAFAALDDGTPTPLLDARLEEWKRLKGSEADRSACGVIEDESAWGRVVVEDFAGARVLDRLLLYERRIESSLYRTMAQLRQERQVRAAAGKLGEVPRSECRLQAGQESVTPTRLASFGADAVPGSQARKATFGSSETPASLTRGTGIRAASLSRQALAVVWNHGQDVHATGTFDGIAGGTGGPPAGGSHGQDAHATETAAGVAQHSRTIPGAPGEGAIVQNEANLGEFQVGSGKFEAASGPSPVAHAPGLATSDFPLHTSTVRLPPNGVDIRPGLC